MTSAFEHFRVSLLWRRRRHVLAPYRALTYPYRTSCHIAKQPPIPLGICRSAGHSTVRWWCGAMAWAKFGIRWNVFCRTSGVCCIPQAAALDDGSVFISHNLMPHPIPSCAQPLKIHNLSISLAALFAMER